MTSRKLYIHIGCHKTGTTSIQHNLAHNHEALKNNGLTFFYENSETGQLRLPDLHSWVYFVDKAYVVPAGMHIKSPEKLAKRLSEIPGDVVISSENFSFFFLQSNIDQLKKSLSPIFSSIKIICYLRRQDKHIISHHQEGSKLSREPEYDIFGHSTEAIPPFENKHMLYLDYNQRLSMWAKAFGDQNMILRIFDRKKLSDGDVVRDFFNIIGIKNYEKIDDKNISVGFRETKIGHLINGANLKHTQSIFHMLQAGEPDNRKMLPARRVAQDYYQHYKAGNAALNKHFNISTDEYLFDDDFSDYPDNLQDLWTEASTNEAIEHILRVFDNTYANLTPDDLRDAAIAIGQTNLPLAIKLLRSALNLRPDGPFIKRKLEEFENLYKSEKPRH